MTKMLSNVDMMSNGTYGVEWEYEDGGRRWEVFVTESERDAVIADWRANELRRRNFKRRRVHG